MNWSTIAHFACLVMALATWLFFSWGKKYTDRSPSDRLLDKAILCIQVVNLLVNAVCLAKEWRSGNIIFALYDFVLIFVIILFSAEIVKQIRSVRE